MVRLVLAIAVGMVLGNFLWELLGAAVDYTAAFHAKCFNKILEKI